jgi:integrase
MGKVAQHQPPREACRRAGVDPPASFHILRHTHATQPLQAEAPLPVIAANLAGDATPTAPVRPPFGTLAARFVLARFTDVLWVVFLTL